jgi:hypothetical protein
LLINQRQNKAPFFQKSTRRRGALDISFVRETTQ